MQLRSWSMRSSIWSLIRWVLSGQKPLLTTRKTRQKRAAASEHTEFAACYKVAPSVVDRANTSLPNTLVDYPIGRRLHLSGSTCDPPGVRSDEAGLLGLVDVRGRVRVRLVDAAEHDEVPRRQAGEPPRDID